MFCRTSALGQRGHWAGPGQYPLYPQKRTLVERTGMSALCQKRTSCGAANCSLFDHLIGTSLQRLWHGQTEGFGGLEINGEFVLGGSLNRKIGRLFTSKNAIDIIRSLTKLVNPIRVASCIISSRKIDPPTGPVTIKPPSAEWAKVATARSISPASRTPTGLISTPRDCAAPWIALNWPIADG